MNPIWQAGRLQGAHFGVNQQLGAPRRQPSAVERAIEQQQQQQRRYSSSSCCVARAPSLKLPFGTCVLTGASKA